MDFNQPTQDFQQWLESLDEAEVRAEVEAVERDRENLQRRQELLEQAVALKHEWLALSPPDGSQTSVSEDDEAPTTSVPGWAAQKHDSGWAGRNDASDQSEPSDAPVTGADGVPVAPNSLAARIGGVIRPTPAPRNAVT